METRAGSDITLAFAKWQIGSYSEIASRYTQKWCSTAVQESPGGVWRISVESAHTVACGTHMEAAQRPQESVRLWEAAPDTCDVLNGAPGQTVLLSLSLSLKCL